jgi:signal peptidase I
MKFSATSLGDTHALKCELAAEVLRSSGTLRLQVTGSSMLPSVLPGDTLIIERATAGTVSEGDVVLFGRDRRLFAHRVITPANRRADSKVITRGDAMPAADPPVTPSDLLGRVALIQRDGKCIAPSRRPKLSQRALAALVRHSDFAARVLVRVHGMHQTS